MPTRPAARPPNACDSAVRCGTAVSGTRESGTPTAKPTAIAPAIQRPVHDAGREQRADDGERHGGDAGEDAAPRGRRGVHPVQREDEEGRRGEVGDLDERHADAAHLRASPRGSVLNILSMRSVIRNPLTMFVIDAKSATAPRTVMYQRVVEAGDHDRADDRDGRDRVRDRHQRRVQQARHPRDDTEADEGREHEHVHHRGEVRGRGRVRGFGRRGLRGGEHGESACHGGASCGRRHSATEGRRHPTRAPRPRGCAFSAGAARTCRRRSGRPSPSRRSRRPSRRPTSPSSTASRRGSGR